MLKVVLVVLFALFAIATAANSTFDFEGTYTWNGTTIYLCQDGSDLSGRIGAEAIFYANVKASDDTVALGKYFYLGDLYTGTRVSFRRFTGGRGRIGLVANSTAMAAYILPRDATGASNGTLLFVADKTSSSISTNSSTRIFDCAIMDRTSSSNVAGHWKTTDNTQINAYICLTESAHGRTNGKMYGSYSFYFTSDGKEILPGYFTGYCAANAQLCGVVYTQLDTDYKSYSTFGAELIYRLSNGRLVIQHTRGAPGIIGFSFRIRANELVYVETAATSDCTQYESSYFNPTKCKQFTLKECKALAPFGFCQVADKQGSCVRNHTFF